MVVLTLILSEDSSRANAQRKHNYRSRYDWTKSDFHKSVTRICHPRLRLYHEVGSIHRPVSHQELVITSIQLDFQLTPPLILNQLNGSDSRKQSGIRASN